MLIDDVPQLTEWMTLPSAAEVLGVTKQTVHNMVSTGKLKSVHTLSAGKKRPLYVVRRSEIEQVFATRKRAVETLLEQQAEREAALLPKDRQAPAEPNPESVEKVSQWKDKLTEAVEFSDEQ